MLDFTTLGLLIGGWAAAASLMVGMFLLQRRLGDAGVVDVAWSLGVVGVTIGYALFATANRERVVLVLIVAIIWGLRLSLYVFLRFRSMPADGRYEKLAEDWGSQAGRRMFRFYQMQAIGILLFSIPILVAIRNPLPLSWLDYVGLTIGLLGVLGESLADWQLARFRRNAANRGQVMQRGLWYYSRHPNYFFEWLHWWAYVGMAILWFPWGCLTLIGPLAMWYFLNFVTGVPQTEAQAIRTRGEAYRRYQQTTNAFFLGFPKNS